VSILALDTTKKTATIATFINQKKAIYNTFEGESHSESLMDKIDEALTSQGANIADIDTFSVVIGPGSFTGIRIGVSLVKAFLFNKPKKCVSVNSFELLAYNINSDDLKGDFLIAFNADNRGCYTATFDRAKKLKNIELFSLVELKDYLKSNKLQFFIKDDEKDYFDIIETTKKAVNLAADTLINLTLQKVKMEEFVSINELEPLYIKLSQAENQYKQKLLNNLTIEKAHISDLSALEKLEKDIFINEAYSRDSIESEITQENREFLVARLNDEIIGYSVIQKTEDNMLNILKIAVKPVYRKLQVATKLFERLNEFAKEKAFEKMFLEVNKHNKPAITFYKKLGFVESYKRKQYYKDGADAIIMFLAV
jgi:tRNA threonylcarbamoyladenosine biosynthesis protein TsaB